MSKLDESDIEFLDGALSYYMTALYLDNDVMREEIREMRVKLNQSLPCEATECDRPRSGMDAYCDQCEAYQEDARRTYQGAKTAGWIKPTESGRIL